MQLKWNYLKKCLEASHAIKMFEMNSKISVNIGKDRNRSISVLNTILSHIINYSKLINNVEMKSSLTVAESVVLTEEIRVYKCLLQILRSHIDRCLSLYRKGEEYIFNKETQHFSSSYKEEGQKGHVAGYSTSSRSKERKHCGDIISCLSKNSVPTSWKLCFGAQNLGIGFNNSENG